MTGGDTGEGAAWRMMPNDLEHPDQRLVLLEAILMESNHWIVPVAGERPGLLPYGQVNEVNHPSFTS